MSEKTVNVNWIGWTITGISYSLALLPYSIVTGNIHGFIYRTLVVTAFVVFWSEINGKAWLEESGRGFIQIITLSLLL